MNMKKYLWLLLVGIILPVAKLGAQTFTVLDDFTNSSTPVYGDSPSGQFAVDGNMLYGTTQFGGATATSGFPGYGAVYSAGANGVPGLTVLHSFTNGTEGAYPIAGLILDNGILYGTTTKGGTGNGGTVFSVSTNGQNFTVLHAFVLGAANDGAIALGRLVLADGVLYGTTSYGGSNGVFADGFGTVFSVTTNGTNFAILHSFTQGYDGENPQADLVLGGKTLYGTANAGGTNATSQFCNGTVFSVDTDGSNFMVLHTFTNSPDGSTPLCGLVLADGILYGTTDAGGTNGIQNGGYGTIFSLSTNGNNYTVLHHFGKSPDGEFIQTGLALAGNTLYGVASSGGFENSTYGTLFSIGTDGSNFTIVRTFENGADGYSPGGVVYANGTLYGTAQGGEILTGGGIPSDGLVYSLIAAATPTSLTIQPGVVSVLLTWDDFSQAYSLQASTNVAGIYTNIPFATSPYAFPLGPGPMFFRLKTH
jgi:uncharacterized repeat protein (TIGR03803 family)